MGVMFTEIDPQDRDAIQEYVESMPALPEPPTAKRHSAK
jgi:hypothetical protein